MLARLFFYSLGVVHQITPPCLGRPFPAAPCTVCINYLYLVPRVAKCHDGMTFVFCDPVQLLSAVSYHKSPLQLVHNGSRLSAPPMRTH